MRIKTNLIFIILAAIWGSSFLFMRIASPAFGAFALAFVRVAVAAVVLGLCLLMLRKQPLKGDKFYLAMGIGVLNSAIPFALFAYAMQHLPVGYTAVLNATVPFWGVAIGVVFLKERLPLSKLIALGCAVIGLLIMLGLGNVDLNHETLLSVIACLLATLLYGIVGYTTRLKLAGTDPVAQSSAAMLGSFLTLIPFAWWQWPAVNPSAGDWAAVITLGVLCSAIAYIMYFWLISNAGLMYGLNVTLLELPPFHGHLNVMKQGVHHVQIKGALHSAI